MRSRGDRVLEGERALDGDDGDHDQFDGGWKIGWNQEWEKALDCETDDDFGGRVVEKMDVE